MYSSNTLRERESAQSAAPNHRGAATFSRKASIQGTRQNGCKTGNAKLQEPLST